MSVDRCKENAVKIVNSKFGDNIKSLSDLKSFYLETKQTAETIENRVSIINHGLRTSCSPSSNFTSNFIKKNRLLFHRPTVPHLQKPFDLRCN